MPCLDVDVDVLVDVNEKLRRGPGYDYAPHIGLKTASRA